MADSGTTPALTKVLYVVSADGSRIAYERFGAGPAVILVGTLSVFGLGTLLLSGGRRFRRRDAE